MNKLDLWTHSQNGTHSYVRDLLFLKNNCSLAGGIHFGEVISPCGHWRWQEQFWNSPSSLLALGPRFIYQSLSNRTGMPQSRQLAWWRLSPHSSRPVAIGPSEPLATLGPGLTHQRPALALKPLEPWHWPLVGQHSLQDVQRLTFKDPGTWLCLPVSWH